MQKYGNVKGKASKTNKKEALEVTSPISDKNSKPQPNEQDDSSDSFVLVDIYEDEIIMKEAKTSSIMMDL